MFARRRGTSISGMRMGGTDPGQLSQGRMIPLVAPSCSRPPTSPTTPWLPLDDFNMIPTVDDRFLYTVHTHPSDLRSELILITRFARSSVRFEIPCSTSGAVRGLHSSSGITGLHCQSGRREIGILPTLGRSYGRWTACSSENGFRSEKGIGGSDRSSEDHHSSQRDGWSDLWGFHYARSSARSLDRWIDGQGSFRGNEFCYGFQSVIIRNKFEVPCD